MLIFIEFFSFRSFDKKNYDRIVLSKNFFRKKKIKNWPFQKYKIMDQSLDDLIEGKTLQNEPVETEIVTQNQVDGSLDSMESCGP